MFLLRSLQFFFACKDSLHFSFALLFSALLRSARNAQGHRYRKPQAFFTKEKRSKEKIPRLSQKTKNPLERSNVDLMLLRSKEVNPHWIAAIKRIFLTFFAQGRTCDHTAYHTAYHIDYLTCFSLHKGSMIYQRAKNIRGNTISSVGAIQHSTGREPCVKGSFRKKSAVGTT